MTDSQTQKYFTEQLNLLQTVLEERIPSANTSPATLHAAMRYSVLNGGKRIRPLLCLAAATALGGDPKKVLLPAAAIEILHSYTLIHDDLPAMDDDELRRGRPTVHVAFGEAVAILAGDALLTLAFELMADTPPPPAPYLPGQLSLELAKASGSLGVIAGQAADIEAENSPPDPELLAFIHRHKTGALIRAAVRIGAVSTGADEASLQALTLYSERLGLAFQIVDDILNAAATTSAIGKTAGSDKKRGKMTWVSVHGIEAAKEQAEQLYRNACAELQPLPGNIVPLLKLAEMAVKRNK